MRTVGHAISWEKSAQLHLLSWNNTRSPQLQFWLLYALLLCEVSWFSQKLGLLGVTFCCGGWEKSKTHPPRVELGDCWEDNCLHSHPLPLFLHLRSTQHTPLGWFSNGLLQRGSCLPDSCQPCCACKTLNVVLRKFTFTFSGGREGRKKC